MDKHDLINVVVQLASQLGRTPTRQEFCNSIRGGQHKLEKQYGTYAILLQAAGLDTYEERRRKPKISNSVFERPIEQHLNEFVPSTVLSPAAYETIASISDLHWPFESKRVIDRFHEYIGDVKPDHVIINGDAWDMYCHGRFPRSHNVFTPRTEEQMARKKNEEFWIEVKKRTPKSKCTQNLGNHDVRPLKRILDEYPAAEDWIQEAFRKLFTFEGVETNFDVRKELVFPGNVIVFHGYRTKLGDHRDYTLMNTINGHTHRGGVVFRSIRGTVIWELNSGLAGDPEAKGLTYTPQRIIEWTPGFAALDKLGPRFIPC